MLLAIERAVIKSIIEDGVFDAEKYSSERVSRRKVPVRIKGKFFAALVLGQFQGGSLKPAELILLRQRGARLRGVTVEEDVDLMRAVGVDGVSHGVIDCEACRFTGVLDLRGAMMRALSLKDCRLVELNGRDATILGSVDLSGIRSAEEPGNCSGMFAQGRCEVQLHNANIAGNLTATGARFVGPEPREGIRTSEVGGRRYALNAPALHVGGTVMFDDAPMAMGGINLADAHVEGDIWIIGGELLAGEGSALRLQSLNTGGNVIIRERAGEDAGAPRLPTRIRGEASFIGAQIGGVTEITRVLAENFAAEEWVLGLDQLQSKALSVSGYLKGRVSMSKMVISGNLQLGGEGLPLRLATPVALAQGEWAFVDLSNTHVEGTLAVRALQFDDTHQVLIGALRHSEVVSLESRDLACYPTFKLYCMRSVDGWGERLTYIVANQKHSYCLDGRSDVFHTINRMGHLKLDSLEAARDYLLLFVNCLIHDAGPFNLPPSESVLGEGTAGVIGNRFVELSVRKEGNLWMADGTLQHGDLISLCQFKLELDGRVEMLDDTTIGTTMSTDYFDAPFRRRLSHDETMLRRFSMGRFFEDGWVDMAAGDIAAWQVRTLARLQRLAPALRPKLDLRGTSCGSLDDINGTEWGNTPLLQVEGFSYQRTVQTESAVARYLVTSAAARRGARGVGLRTAYRLVALRAATSQAVDGVRRKIGRLRRLVDGQPPHHVLGAETVWADHDRRDTNRAWYYRRDWLRLQFPDFRPVASHFHPQPYEQLAQVFERSGLKTSARQVLSYKITLENRFYQFWLFLPLSWAFWLCFDYGLSARRSLLTVASLVLLGTVATQYAVQRDILVLDVTPIASMATMSGDRVGIAIANPESIGADIPCGETISPLLYALDVFLPLIDLRQEMRCDVRSSPLPAGEQGSWIAFFDNMSWWSLGKSIYSILGWIVTSVAILACTGLIRRDAENDR